MTTPLKPRRLPARQSKPEQQREPDREPHENTEGLRVPPSSIEAESAVLGAIMLRNDALAEVADWISEGDFFRRDHRTIYRAMMELAAKTPPSPLDAVTLCEWFAAQGGDLLELVGGSSYVIELANSTPSAANIAAYAEIVKEKSALRTLIDVGTEAAGDAFTARQKTAELIASETITKLSRISTSNRPKASTSAKSIVGELYAEMARKYDDKDDALTGIATPWPGLNDLTNGLQPGDLIVLAGRSNMGKTIGAENISTFHALNTGKRVDVYSMEMRRHAWMRRAWASTAHVQFQHLQKPHLIVEGEWPTIMHAQDRLAASRLNIDDTPGLTAAQLIARAERQQLRDPTSLIVIDNLSEIVLPGKDRTDIELGNACKGFSRMGKKFGVPVILLVHVNRDVTKGSDKRPTMAHLRNSGEIEQIADLILMLHREDYYNRETHMKKVVEMIVGKGRDIPTGEILYFENVFAEMRMKEWEGALPKAAPKVEKPKKTLTSETKDYAERRGQ